MGELVAQKDGRRIEPNPHVVAVSQMLQKSVEIPANPRQWLPQWADIDAHCQPRVILALPCRIPACPQESSGGDTLTRYTSQSLGRVEHGMIDVPGPGKTARQAAARPSPERHGLIGRVVFLVSRAGHDGVGELAPGCGLMVISPSRMNPT